MITVENLKRNKYWNSNQIEKKTYFSAWIILYEKKIAISKTPFITNCLIMCLTVQVCLIANSFYLKKTTATNDNLLIAYE